MSFAISRITALEILDSRGNPTLSVTVELNGGARGEVKVPSGASTGSHEAVELRDHDARRYKGKGVTHALQNVLDVIAPALSGKSFQTQAQLDHELLVLDGTPNKSRLGANAILGVSLAFARAVAQAGAQPLYQELADSNDLTLPVPMLNVLNGGVHAQTSVDFQEFMLVPFGFSKFADAIRAGSECFQVLRQLLKDAGHQTGQGDEGGFAPSLRHNEEAVEFLIRAIESAGYRPGEDVAIALDPATSELYREGRYVLRGEGRELSSAEMVELWAGWCERYPIISLEDGMAEDDWDGWEALTSRLGEKVQLVGDDIFVTQTARLQRGIEHHVGNSVLIKVNQVGTLTETLETISLARNNGYTTVISHRSGETEDTFIADLAVATGAGQIKAGAPSRSERVAKYNRLLQIESELGAPFAGRNAYPRISAKEHA